jgi:DNA-binding HxlR family transcriptional regulator
MIPANSVARALVHIGDRWSLLIVGTAFQGVRRFDEWHKGIGIASNILASRLNRLVNNGCLEKLPAEDGNRFIYHLTDMGRELFPTALMFWRFDRLWSRRHPLQPVALIHVPCGHAMTPSTVCAHCREPVVARDVRYEDGPGAGMDKMPPPKSSRRSNVTLGDGAVIDVLFGESVDFFGDRWTQLVLASFFLGERRYEEIRARWHIATNVLADRLRLLVDTGMLQRRIYQTNPERSEYLLTPKGMDVFPIVLTLMKWGDRWLAPKGARPLILTHTRCGAELDPIVVCDHCGDELDPHEVTFLAKKSRALKPVP